MSVTFLRLRCVHCLCRPLSGYRQHQQTGLSAACLCPPHQQPSATVAADASTLRGRWSPPAGEKSTPFCGPAPASRVDATAGHGRGGSARAEDHEFIPPQGPDGHVLRGDPEPDCLMRAGAEGGVEAVSWGRGRE